MDAHVFRLVGGILAASLYRARLERIHEPVPGITAFSLFVSGTKRCLLFRKHRSAPLLFLTDKSPLPNPAFPPASVMRLRKYAEGRILGEARLDWLERRLAFALPGPAGTSTGWLLLDCRNGPAIVQTLPATFDRPPAWPDPAHLPDLLHTETDEDAAPWKDFQVLTPLLRRTLATLDPPDAAALLVDLEAGNGDLFWYSPGEKDAPPRAVSAWPLPSALKQTGDEKISVTLRETVTPATAEAVLQPLEALSLPLLLVDAKNQTDAPAVKQDKSAGRKRKRLLAKLEEERKRLDAMLLLGNDARLIQTHLWRFSPDERMENIRLPLDPAMPEEKMRTIQLNPLISVTDNMRLMFRKAGKATRGLAMLEQRLALVREMPLETRPAVAAPQQYPDKGKSKKTVFSPSLIQEFVSTDGFTLWRGRSAEGNRTLLKLANPFDFWLHVEDGPSAHLLIRRDHAAQDVPENTLREAAVLVGLKSWRKNDPKAPVMVALAKHVQPVKGAGPGTVRVQTQLRSVFVSLDEALETSLRREAPLSTKGIFQ